MPTVNTKLHGDALQDLAAPCSNTMSDQTCLQFGPSKVRDRLCNGKLFGSGVSSPEGLPSASKAQRGLVKTQVKTIALHEGINKIPDEILAIIMEFAVSNVGEACRMSEVCTRFRSVMLSSPRIWADCGLSLHSKPKEVSTILQRSKDIPLTARVDLNPYASLNANAISQHTASIGELHVSQVNSPIIRDYFTGMRLPILRRLSMRRSDYIPTKRTEQPTPHAYETWSMPRLRSISVNFVPRPALGKSILNCEFCFNQSPIVVSELLGFLASCSVLEVLDLSFKGTTSRKEPKSNQIVRLPKLNTLVLRVSNNAKPSLLSCVLKPLACTKLSELSVIVKEDLQEEAVVIDAPVLAARKHFKERMDTIYRFIRNHQTLKNLRIWIEAEGRGDYEMIASYIVEQFDVLLNHLPPNLETLALADDIAIHWGRRRKGRMPPPTTCLRISGKKSWPMDFARALQRSTLVGNGGPKMIVLEHCLPTDYSKLRAIFPCSDIVCR